MALSDHPFCSNTSKARAKRVIQAGTLAGSFIVPSDSRTYCSTMLHSVVNWSNLQRFRFSWQLPWQQVVVRNIILHPTIYQSGGVVRDYRRLQGTAQVILTGRPHRDNSNNKTLVISRCARQKHCHIRACLVYSSVFIRWRCSGQFCYISFPGADSTIGSDVSPSDD